MKKTILIIEDDKKIAELIAMYLDKEGFRTVISHDGEEGLDLALKIEPTLLILDRMLPNLEGLEILKQLRARLGTPVLILSAKSDEIEKVIGLELGADDYLSKPFSPKELVARVKAILRRGETTGPIKNKINLSMSDLIINPEKMEVLQGNKTIPLSSIEFKLLYLLAQHPGRVFTRDQLMTELYSSSQSVIFDRTMDAHVKNLRKKLKDSARKPRYIASVFGVGYKSLET